MLLTLLIIVVTIGFLHLFRKLIYSEAKRYPPGPLRLPWIGSAYAMGTKMTRIHVTLTDLAKKWGPIYRLQIGPTPLVVISDPDIIREVFHNTESPVILRFVSETSRQMDQGSSIMFADSRDKWALARKMYHPIIRAKPDGTSIPQVITVETARLLAAMDNRLNQEVYLNPLFMFFTRNVFLQLALSKYWSFDTKTDEEREFNHSMCEALDSISHIADYIPALDFLAKKSRKNCMENCHKIEQFLSREISRREAEGNKQEIPRDLVDLLIEDKKRNPEFTEEAMLYTFRNMLFAGTVTVSDSLDWLVLYLCEHPDIQEKCYRELAGKLEGRSPTIDDQHELPYLDAVLKETFRIRPPAPLSLQHCADRDCTIAGYDIEKGSIIMQNIYAIGNLDKFFKNPTEFDPDRWFREPGLSSHLLTFGYGPTICLGMPIAKQEFFLAAASLLQRYKFEIGPSTPSPDKTGEFKITFNPKPWNTIVTVREAESGKGSL